MKIRQYLTESVSINIGDIVKVGPSKWELFRKWGDHTFSVYKYGTKQRKIYSLEEIQNNKWEVWLINGMGDKMGKKPIATGIIKIIKQTKTDKPKQTKTTSSLPSGFEGFGFK